MKELRKTTSMKMNGSNIVNKSAGWLKKFKQSDHKKMINVLCLYDQFLSFFFINFYFK